MKPLIISFPDTLHRHTALGLHYRSKLLTHSSTTPAPGLGTAQYERLAAHWKNKNQLPPCSARRGRGLNREEVRLGEIARDRQRALRRSDARLM